MSLLASVADALKIWHFSGDDLRLTVSCEYPREQLSSIAWNHTNQVVAVGGTARKVYLVQVNNGQLLSTIPFSNQDVITGDISSLAFSSNSRYLASGAGRTVYVWDLKNRETNSLLQGLRGNVNAVKFFDDGRIASGDSSGALRLWNIKDNTSSIDLLHADARTSMTALEISQTTPTKVACAYEDGSLCVWDPETQELLRRQTLHSGHMSSLAFSPKNLSLLATGGYDGKINLVDIGAKSTGNLSASIDTGEKITAISFHSDAVHAAIGTMSGSILLYDWRNVRKPVSRVPAHLSIGVSALRFQSAGSTLASKAIADPTKATSISSGGSVFGSVRTENRSEYTKVSPDVPPLASISSLKNSSTTTTATAHPTAATAPPMSLKSSVDNVSSMRSEPRSEQTSKNTLYTGSPPPPPTESSFDSTSFKPTTSLPKGPAVITGLTSSSVASSVSRSAEKDPGGRYPAPLSTTSFPAASLSNSRSFSSKVPGTAAAAGGSGDRDGCIPGGGSGTGTTGRESVADAKPSQSTESYSPLYKDYNIDDTFPGEFDDLKRAVRPVNSQELQEALGMLRYDLHREVQAIIREQIRQFAISKEETAQLMESMSEQLAELLAANAALRAENESLRKKRRKKRKPSQRRIWALYMMPYSLKDRFNVWVVAEKLFELFLMLIFVELLCVGESL
eukprot:gene8879-18381_t